jgi:hypothetical protein
MNRKMVRIKVLLSQNFNSANSSYLLPAGSSENYRCGEVQGGMNITLSSVGSSEEKATLKQELSLSSNKFSFANVLPGKYILEVSVRLEGFIR